MAERQLKAAFRFTTTWEVPAAPGRVFQTLADLSAYPAWWPQVEIQEIRPDQTCLVHVRGLLPRRIQVTLSPRTADKVVHRLGIWVSGDLQGWAQWLLGPGRDPETTVARYHHEVTFNASRLRSVALSGPVRLSHAWLFRQGHRGLVRHLDSSVAGTRPTR